MRYHEHRGERALARIADGGSPDEALRHLERVEQVGLWTSPELRRRLASLYALPGRAGAGARPDR